MDHLKSELKKAMNEIMHKESVFSELEKQKVFHTIKGNNQENPIPKKYLIPRTLTGLLSLCFILLLGGMAGNYFEILNNSSSFEEDVKEFYPETEVGEELNGWTLKNKGPKQDSSGLLEAVFLGETEITGKLIYDNQNEKLFFEPNQEEASALPLMDNQIKQISFNIQDQELIMKIFGISGSVTIEEITIKINQYIGQYKRDKEITDMALLDRVVLPEENEPVSVPFSLLFDSQEQIVLPEKLQTDYKDFSVSKDAKLLAGLSPADIFQFYYYAEEQNENDVQYALFIEDEEYLKPFETLEDYENAKKDPISAANTVMFMNKMKKAELSEVIMDESNAIVQIGEETGFKIIKDNNGIWRVSWLPLQ